MAREPQCLALTDRDIGFIVGAGHDSESVSLAAAEEPVGLLGHSDVCEALSFGRVRRLAATTDGVSGQPEGPLLAFGEGVQEGRVMAGGPSLGGGPAYRFDEVGQGWVGLTR